MSAAVHRADSGVETYDRTAFFLPPPRVTSAVSAPSGTGALLQLGHSRAASAATQEVVSALDAHALLFFPEGWARENEIRTAQDRLEGLAGFQCFVIAPREEVRWVTRPTDAAVAHLHIPTPLVGALREDAVDRSPGASRFVTLGRRFAPLARAFVDHLRSGGLDQPLLLDSYAALLAPILWEAPDRGRAGGLAPHVLKRVADYVCAALDREITLVELAGVAGLSVYHFLRAFKQSTGMPPHAWLTQKRMERARALMRTHADMGIAEIAVCVGYENQSAFTTAFKRIVGATPAQWRREHTA